jgi:four helix bundle protein
MSKIKSFEELTCWQKSRELVRLVYSVCRDGKLAKNFSTQDQVKRAALSVMNNIAEGFGRESRKEFVRFLDISQSSCMEVKSMTYVFEDLDYLTREQIQKLRTSADETKGLVRGLIKYLRANPAP